MKNMLEQQIEQIWINYGISIRDRQGWRDCLIALGPAPLHYRNDDRCLIKDRHGQPIRKANEIKYRCCKQILNIIEKDSTMALLSSNNYVRQFAEQMLKSTVKHPGKVEL